MKLTPFKFNGVTYYLLLNGAALFDIYDQFGDKGSVLDHIKGNSRSAFEAICWYLEELATQGELLRRHMGNDRQTVPSVDLFMTLLSPLDVSRARAALYSAIASGFGREAEQPREVDKGLLELEKKRAATYPQPVLERRLPVPGSVSKGGPAAPCGAGAGYGGGGDQPA